MTDYEIIMVVLTVLRPAPLRVAGFGPVVALRAILAPRIPFGHPFLSLVVVLITKDQK